MFKRLRKMYVRWKHTSTFTGYLQNQQTGVKSEVVVVAIPQLDGQFQFTHYTIVCKQTGWDTGMVMREMSNRMTVCEYRALATEFAS